jgi:hypothetical protein
MADVASATIVTAFFVMGRERSHSGAAYELWAGRLLLQVRSPMIVTANKPAMRWLAALREKRERGSIGPALWEETELPKLSVVKRYGPPRRPPRGKYKHDLFYTYIMHEKVVLLDAAARRNPFNTSHFIWVDLGMWRAEHSFASWPGAARLSAWPSDRALGLLVYPFAAGALRRNYTFAAAGHGDPRRLARAWGVIGGGIFGGTRLAVSRLSRLYFALLDEMARTTTGWATQAAVTATDQHVFRRAYLHAPEAFALVAPPPAQWCHHELPALVVTEAHGDCVHPEVRRRCVAPTRQAVGPPCAGTSSSWMYLIAWLAARAERQQSAVAVAAVSAPATASAAAAEELACLDLAPASTHDVASRTAYARAAVCSGPRTTTAPHKSTGQPKHPMKRTRRTNTRG